MSRVYPSGQRADAEFAYHTWLTLYNGAYAAAKPIMRKLGLLEATTTRTKSYHVTIPPVALGEEVEETTDGNDWPTSGIQGSEVKGTIKKQGPKGLHLTEDDLMEDVIGAANARVQALGRAKAFWEDRKGTATLQGGLTQIGADNKAIYAADHPWDAITTKGVQSNTYGEGLNPDGLHKVCAGFADVRAENGDPFFGDDAELEFVLAVPAALKADAEKATGREFVGEAGAGVSNVAYRMARLAVLPRLTDPTRWFVAVTNMTRKAVLKVEFRAMQDFRRGPESDLWKSKQVMTLTCNEKSDYLIPDWRLVATSKR